ncbi:MAG: hypothetical protein NZ772_05280 [Cyanobacteria bacterium]|nr:hypothetical protein [Cyanobacteriota bacterium]MDW8200009.1 hypothetical protein [Cyanobacteriota bacterium SKYGB_h_bin112]
MNWNRLLSAAVAAIIVTLTIKATAQPNGSSRDETVIVPVTDLICTQNGRGGYWDVDHDVVVARRLLTASAFMGNIFKPGVHQSELIETVCSLAPTPGTQGFRRLALAFGFADDAPYSDEQTAVRIALYKDGLLEQEQVIKRGETGRFLVSLRDNTSFTIDHECVIPARGFDYCPNVYFFEDSLDAIPVPPPPPEPPFVRPAPPPPPSPAPVPPAPPIIPQTW